MARGRWEPVVRDGGEIAPRMMLPLSLSYDHRVIDGADGARFARRVAVLLSEPYELVLKG
jgi:pyruvate dehydrogenase E2 component (dihydrolipoamide acetyltransferase)